MRPAHRLITGLAATALVIPAASPAMGESAPSPEGDSAQVVLDWERISFATVYPVTPIPSGVPILGFTSVAMYDAARTSLHHASSSETAAVAAAAHDVLLHYFPAAATSLDDHLTSTLAAVPDGPAEALGRDIGEAAAVEMIASRSGDGYGDSTIHYSLAPGIGVWQPVPPATDMLVPWLGSLRPLVLEDLLEVDGPDAVTSPAYAVDFNEVKRLGSAGSTARTPKQTDTAVFFNSNSATMVGDAVIRHLEGDPTDIGSTAKLFAAMHASMTDTVIKCWQLKRDVGLWRPFQAIAAAGFDGNRRTSPQAGWAPLIPNPGYSDYVSGHACLTSSAIEVTRQLLGEGTALELRSSNFPDAPRRYASLNRIEHDAFWSRIWGGLHFRDAMEDGYELGHRTARQVLGSLDEVVQ